MLEYRLQKPGLKMKFIEIRKALFHICDNHINLNLYKVKMHGSGKNIHCIQVYSE